ncbi:hypothetical protein K431DRAFT_42049 [Polychaeton citri CBS 116435]|uniref:DC-UbP/UBTD2 N-terminal domain-containing protein n=1 Tax=Polychaeton citri CBS 116435 TaxID=1314669 RepID=A0A9P4QAX3_9PEZI|nr:hypothetical protein K431DRAFT_42049 [Polychaeton citri CBS 116435]
MGSCISRATEDEGDGNGSHPNNTHHPRLNQAGMHPGLVLFDLVDVQVEAHQPILTDDTAAHSEAAQKPAARPTAPLRLPTPLATSPKHLVQHPPPWNRSVLDRERAAHFETQAELHPELQENWYAVKVACEKLRGGQLKEAESLLEGVGLSCPSGKFTSGRSIQDGVKGGLFDGRGREYGVPGWCVVDPDDLTEESPPHTQTAAEEWNEWEGNKVEVKVRPAAGDEKLVVMSVEPGRPTQYLIDLVASKLGVKSVRLTYRGRVLNGSDRFESVSYKQSDIINAQVLR